MRRRQVLTLLGLVGLLIAALALTLWWRASSRGDAELVVEVLDVGQGGATLLRLPGGEAVLIDGGGGGRDLLVALRARGVDRLDMVMATHPHHDRIAGLQPVLETMPVGVFVDNGMPHTLRAYLQLMDTVERLELPYVEARQGRGFDLGDGAVLEVLMPPGKLLRATRSDINANSLVLRLTWRDHCALLMADAEDATEQILTVGGVERCEVLQVAHSGSRHSTSERILDQVQPSIALISVGADNRYGHPTEDTLERLRAAGATTYRTDLHGDIRVIFTEEGARVETGER